MGIDLEEPECPELLIGCFKVRQRTRGPSRRREARIFILTSVPCCPASRSDEVEKKALNEAVNNRNNPRVCLCCKLRCVDCKRHFLGKPGAGKRRHTGEVKCCLIHPTGSAADWSQNLVPCSGRQTFRHFSCTASASHHLFPASSFSAFSASRLRHQ